MIAADDDDDWCLIRLVLMDKMLWKGFWKVSNVKSSDAVDVDDSNKTKKVLNWSWRHLSVAEGGVPVNNLYLKSTAVAVIFWSWFVRQHVIQKQLQPWIYFYENKEHSDHIISWLQRQIIILLSDPGPWW